LHQQQFPSDANAADYPAYYQNYYESYAYAAAYGQMIAQVFPQAQSVNYDGGGF